MKRKLTALLAITLLITMFAGSALADMELYEATLTVGYNDVLYKDVSGWYKDDDSRAWLSILLYLDMFSAEVMPVDQLLDYDIETSYVGYEKEGNIMIVLYPGKTDALVCMYTPATETAAWGLLSISPTESGMETSMNAVCAEFTKLNPESYATIWGDLTSGD